MSALHDLDVLDIYMDMLLYLLVDSVMSCLWKCHLGVIYNVTYLFSTEAGL